MCLTTMAARNFLTGFKALKLCNIGQCGTLAFFTGCACFFGVPAVKYMVIERHGGDECENSMYIVAS
jgi:hypothetical protein